MLPAGLGTYAALLRWLGPWTPDGKVPRDVTRQVITVDAERPFEAWVYRPARAAVGAYLIAPGLHYAGPADPRLDRFCKILAASGFVVLAPFLPDYTALVVVPTVIDDLERAFDALLALPNLPAVAPGIFSISFGSMPASRLASSVAYRDRLGALILFGGYADFGATVRFILGVDGEQRPRDPLNPPVVMINLADQLSGHGADIEVVVAAWRAFVEATWGRLDMKVPAAYGAVADRLARDLGPAERALFLLGCDLRPGLWDAVSEALAAQIQARPCLDPRPHFAGLRCPVHIVHGLDDDVIPPTELDALAAAMPDGIALSTYRTGLYSHTGLSVGALGGVAREVATLLRMLGAIVESGTQPQRR